MPGLCMSRAAMSICAHGHFRIRIRSPIQQYRKTTSFIKAKDKSSELMKEFSCSGELPESESGNRVMVVVDSSAEAKGALDWALSHTYIKFNVNLHEPRPLQGTISSKHLTGRLHVVRKRDGD